MSQIASAISTICICMLVCTNMRMSHCVCRYAFSIHYTPQLLFLYWYYSLLLLITIITLYTTTIATVPLLVLLYKVISFYFYGCKKSEIWIFIEFYNKCLRKAMNFVYTHTWTHTKTFLFKQCNRRKIKHKTTLVYIHY